MTEETDSAPDVVKAIQDALQNAEPNALCTGFAVVAEWLEEDGSAGLTLLHTPMPPWHLAGMFAHAGQWTSAPRVCVTELDPEALADLEEGDSDLE